MERDDLKAEREELHDSSVKCKLLQEKQKAFAAEHAATEQELTALKSEEQSLRASEKALKAETVTLKEALRSEIEKLKEAHKEAMDEQLQMLEAVLKGESQVVKNMLEGEGEVLHTQPGPRAYSATNRNLTLTRSLIGGGEEHAGGDPGGARRLLCRAKRTAEQAGYCRGEHKGRHMPVLTPSAEPKHNLSPDPSHVGSCQGASCVAQQKGGLPCIAQHDGCV